MLMTTLVFSYIFFLGEGGEGWRERVWSTEKIIALYPLSP